MIDNIETKSLPTESFSMTTKLKPLIIPKIKSKQNNENNNHNITNKVEINENEKTEIMETESIKNQKDNMEIKMYGNYFKIEDDIIEIKSEYGNFIRFKRSQWITSEKGGAIPMLDGYVFHSNRGWNYKCKHKDCPATCKHDGWGNLIYPTNKSIRDHNHAPDIWEILYKETTIEIATKNKGMNRRAQSIIKESYMIESNIRKSTAEKWIRDILNEDKPGNTIEEMLIDSVFSSNILFHDEEMLIFGDKRLFPLLAETEMIFIDGTWSIAPTPHFKQLYSIHCLKCGNAFPVIYALLPNKKDKTYTKLFNLVKEITNVDISKTGAYIMGDFELCSMKFFDDKSKVKNCWFHHNQSVYRKAQKISKIEYEEKESFYKLCKNIMVLPLVKPKRVPKIFKFLEKNFKSKNEKELLKYYKENYLQGKYKIENWNVRNIPMRTNNFVESFHGFINRVYKLIHPPLRECISTINKIIDTEYIKYLEVCIKMNPLRKDKKQIQKQNLLYQIMSDEDSYTDKDLLEALVKYDPMKKIHYEDEEDEDAEKEEDGLVDNKNNQEKTKEVIEIEDDKNDEKMEIEQNDSEVIEIIGNENDLQKVKTIEIKFNDLKQYDDYDDFPGCWTYHSIDEDYKQMLEEEESPLEISNKRENTNNNINQLKEDDEKRKDDEKNLMEEEKKEEDNSETETELGSETEIEANGDICENKENVNQIKKQTAKPKKPKSIQKKKKPHEYNKTFSCKKMKKALSKGKNKKVNKK